MEAGAWRDHWDLRPGVTYLNHGSFGPPPQVVQRARQHWQAELDRNPMDFFVRHYEPAWFAARQTLATFVGAAAENLVFADNATSAMNVVAHSFPLQAGDEVLVNDHEYGAVVRIWQRATQAVGAALRSVRLPLPVQSAEQIVEALFAAATSRTRLIVVSHITSPTAITLPVASICAQARRRGIARSAWTGRMPWRKCRWNWRNSAATSTVPVATNGSARRLAAVFSTSLAGITAPCGRPS